MSYKYDASVAANEVVSYDTFANISPVQGDATRNVLLLNAAMVASAVTLTDSFFSSVSQFKQLVFGTTTSGSQSVTLGENYKNAGFHSIESQTTAGSMKVDAMFSYTDSDYNLQSTSGTLDVFSGDTKDSITLAATSGAITVSAGDNNHTINTSTTSGATSITIHDKVGTVNNGSISTTSGLVLFSAEDGNNNFVSQTTSGGNTIYTGNGDNHFGANSTSGGITATIGSGDNVFSAKTTSGAVTVTIGGGDNVITSATQSGGITISTGNGDNTIAATSASGRITITTGAGNDNVAVSSGSAGSTVNAGSGVNVINIVDKSAGINTIVATDLTSANLVQGSSSALSIFHLGTVTFGALEWTTQSLVAGTTAASVSPLTGLLTFTGTPTATGADFAAQVLQFLGGTSEAGKVVAYDDGANQWLFASTNENTGHYVELVGIHIANFEGASVTSGVGVLQVG